MISHANKKGNNLNLHNKKYYEIFIFAILMFEFAVLNPGIQHMDEWNTTYYFLSYQDFGFNSRLLIGSIFKFFTEYISNSTLFYCILAVIICMNASVAVILGKILRNFPDESLSSLKVFIILFLINPFSLATLFDKGNFGIFDIYLVITTIIMMLVVRHNYFKWLIPALCMIALGIQQVYIVTYMPIIVVILIYEWYKSGYKKSYIVLCGVSFSLMIFLFVYFEFLAPELPFNNAKEVVSFLSHRTDIALSYVVINDEYFFKATNWFSEVWHFTSLFVIPYGVCALVVTSPLIVIFFSLWSTAFKKAKDKFAKFIMLLCITAPLISLPIFTQTDWDRWISAIFIVQFSLAIYFLASGFNCVIESADNIRNYFQKHKLLFAVIIIYLSMLMFSDERILFGIILEPVADSFQAFLAR